MTCMLVGALMSYYMPTLIHTHTIRYVVYLIFYTCTHIHTSYIYHISYLIPYITGEWEHKWYGSIDEDIKSPNTLDGRG